MWAKQGMVNLKSLFFFFFYFPPWEWTKPNLLHNLRHKILSFIILLLLSVRYFSYMASTITVTCSDVVLLYPSPLRFKVKALGFNLSCFSFSAILIYLWHLFLFAFICLWYWDWAQGLLGTRQALDCQALPSVHILHTLSLTCPRWPCAHHPSASTSRALEIPGLRHPASYCSFGNNNLYH